MPQDVDGRSGNGAHARPAFTPPWTLSHGGQADRLTFAYLEEAIAEAVKITRSNSNSVLVRDSAPPGARLALLVHLQEERWLKS